MQGLCMCILKGQYKKLPKQYSRDLAKMIKVMLTVDAAKRPSCNQLMAMPEFIGRAHQLHPKIAQQISSKASPIHLQHQDMHTISSKHA